VSKATLATDFRGRLPYISAGLLPLPPLSGNYDLDVIRQLDGPIRASAREVTRAEERRLDFSDREHLPRLTLAPHCVACASGVEYRAVGLVACKVGQDHREIIRKRPSGEPVNSPADPSARLEVEHELAQEALMIRLIVEDGESAIAADQGPGKRRRARSTRRYLRD